MDLGLQLTERANSWAKLLGLSEQVHYMMANATVSLESMLASYPGPLSLVTVQVRMAVLWCNGRWSPGCMSCRVRVSILHMQFPDPHFKARHKKRRIVQRQLVHAIGRLMPAGGEIFAPVMKPQ